MSLYARPALACMDVVFHAADGFEPGVVFLPNHRARAELAQSSLHGWRLSRSCLSICALKWIRACLRRTRVAPPSSHVSQRISAARSGENDRDDELANVTLAVLKSGTTKRPTSNLTLIRKKSMRRSLGSAAFRIFVNQSAGGLSFSILSAAASTSLPKRLGRFAEEVRQGGSALSILQIPLQISVRGVRDDPPRVGSGVICAKLRRACC